MTTLPCSSPSSSEGTIELDTGAILLREGARAVGSTYARPWDSVPESEPEPAPAPAPASVTPSLPPLPMKRATPVAATRASSARPRREASVISVPWSFAGAFALGATIAAVAGLVLDRGAVELAALASAVAGGMTLSAALARVATKGRAGRGPRA